MAKVLDYYQRRMVPASAEVIDLHERRQAAARMTTADTAPPQKQDHTDRMFWWALTCSAGFWFNVAAAFEFGGLATKYVLAFAQRFVP